MSAARQGFLVRLAIVVEYRKNILYDITEVVANSDAEVRGAELSSKEAIAVGHFVIEIKNISHLNRVIAAIRKKIPRVIKIDRVFGGETDQGESNESSSNG